MPFRHSIFAAFGFAVSIAASPLSPETAAVALRDEQSASGHGVVQRVAIEDPLVNIVASDDQYIFYSGDGSSSSGWPDISAWMSFDDLWDRNKAIVGTNCINGVVINSLDETESLYHAIRDVGAKSSVDDRVILAVVMEESNGCVRAPMSTSPDEVSNAGLMQSHNGAGTCNANGTPQDPCPHDNIHQMIEDGTMGTKEGNGLVQDLDLAGSSDSQSYYKAVRLYNSGDFSIPANGDLSAPTPAKSCYASDVANRLTGWLLASSGCLNVYGEL